MKSKHPGNCSPRWRAKCVDTIQDGANLKRISLVFFFAGNAFWGVDRENIGKQVESVDLAPNERMSEEHSLSKDRHLKEIHERIKPFRER